MNDKLQQLMKEIRNIKQISSIQELESILAFVKNSDIDIFHDLICQDLLSLSEQTLEVILLLYYFRYDEKSIMEILDVNTDTIRKAEDTYLFTLKTLFHKHCLIFPNIPSLFLFTSIQNAIYALDYNCTSHQKLQKYISILEHKIQKYRRRRRNKWKIACLAAGALALVLAVLLFTTDLRQAVISVFSS